MESFLVNATVPKSPPKNYAKNNFSEKRIHRRPIDRRSADLYSCAVKLRVKGLTFRVSATTVKIMFIGQNLYVHRETPINGVSI